MRRLSDFVLIALALSACAHPSATSGTGAASQSAASVDRNPCADARACSVDIVIPEDVASLLARAGANYKVYPGCPRSLGFTDAGAKVPFTVGRGTDNASVGLSTNTSMRGAIPVAQSQERTVIIPRMSGRIATVAIFYAGDPGKYAVVDFGRGPSQTVKFGYLYSGRGLSDDNLADQNNRTADRRIC